MPDIFLSVIDMLSALPGLMVISARVGEMLRPLPPSAVWAPARGNEAKVSRITAKLTKIRLNDINTPSLLFVLV
jgi:hypothetical protein